jgi:large subunit ribosomal protein L23
VPKQLHPYNVLRRPVVTEKSTLLAGQNQYVFEVDREASKQQIKEAVQLAFSVEVKAVNVMNVRGKMRRFRRGPAAAPDWKKAVVTLQPGHKIELIEGV